MLERYKSAIGAGIDACIESFNTKKRIMSDVMRPKEIKSSIKLDTP
jgi:hypothetical protein